MSGETEWAAVKAWAEKEIEALRDDLEGALDPIPTANRRGQIAALRALLKRAEPPKIHHEPDLPPIAMTGGPDGY